MLSIQKDHQSVEEAGAGMATCVVTPRVVQSGGTLDAGLAMFALAQQLALGGQKVTLLSVDRPDDNAAADAAAASLWERYGINLEYLRKSDDFMYESPNVERRSYFLYRAIQGGRFDHAILPLDCGLPYYALLAQQTDVFGSECRLVVVAHAPTEWRSEREKKFPDTAEFAKAAFMERESARLAPRLICTSTGVLDWMRAKGWQLDEGPAVLPALQTLERAEQRSAGMAGGPPAPEIVLVAGSNFADGVPFFCDMLDQLSRLNPPALSISWPGTFGRILGEHSGGMVLRRARRWPFQLRIMSGADEDQAIAYAYERNALAVIPNDGGAMGYAVAECIRRGVSFVALAGGANGDRVDPADAASCLAPRRPMHFAELVASAISSRVQVSPKVTDASNALEWMSLTVKMPAGVQKRPRGSKRTKTPLVSVVITHYERPNLVLQAVQSVREQDYPNIEVVLVDDGSRSEAARQVLDRLQGDFDNRDWRIIRAPNRQVGAARNTGVKAARGDLIVLLDDDNALYPKAVSTFVRALQKSGSDVCMALCKNFHSAEIPRDEAGHFVTHIPVGACLDVAMLGNSFGDTISIYRKGVFAEAGYQIESMENVAEDWEFFVRLAAMGFRMTLIPEVLFWYRVNTTGRYKSSHHYDNITAVIETLSRHGFKGLVNLPSIFVGQNIDRWTADSNWYNLSYSPADALHHKLTEMEPNSDQATALLAHIAAVEGRPATSAALANGSVPAQFPDFWSLKRYDYLSASTIKLASHDNIFCSTASGGHDEAYFDGDILFIPVRDLETSLVVFGGVIEEHVASASVTMYTPEEGHGPVEVALAVVDDADPQVAWRSVDPEALVWRPLADNSGPVTVTVDVAPSHRGVRNLLAVFRGVSCGKRPVFMCVREITICQSLDSLDLQRPRRSPPVQRRHRRIWTDEQRHRARLVEHVAGDLPHLLVEPQLENGLFLRPVEKGANVAIIERGFPRFARSVVAEVEIASEEATSFEFATALGVFGRRLVWNQTMPVSPIAFSGWKLVSSKHARQRIALTVADLIADELDIYLAIRTPAGARIAPSNTYFRKLAFHWDD